MAVLKGTRVLLTVCLGILTCLPLADGAAFMVLDDCPDGVGEGETWIPEIVPGTSVKAQCMKCSCLGDSQGYGCYSCGAAFIPLNSTKCYVTKVTPDLPYPECCSLVQRCPGQPEYDPTQAGNTNPIG
ncbi:uncharacterized protein LOC143291161 [Babylonia areolata]|uniref:uncharacterized protein LOC143291161 n=1 Tax=Babylonia areolata TaxID=304850 RepID=UPI003FD5FB09